MSEETLENKKEKRLSFWNFLSTIKWLVLFNFKLSFWTVFTQIIVRILIDVSPLFNAYIFARLLDKIIKIVSSSNYNLYDTIPLLILLLCFNLIISAFSSLYGYVAISMNNISIFKLPIILAEKINSLGLQTLENPEVVNKIQRAKETINTINIDFERSVVFFARLIVLVFVSTVIIKIMPIIAIIIIIAIIPKLISNRIHMKKSWSIWRSETENQRRAFSATSSLNETTSLQEITITSSFGLLSKIFNDFSKRLMYGQIKNQKKLGFF